MKTKIADELRKLRLESGENLKVMAEKLGVSSAFLSAIENGKKNMPESVLCKMQDIYSLSDARVESFRTAALESQKSISLNLENASDNNRELAVCFARQFKDIDDETNKKIMDLLRRRNIYD